MSKPSVLPVTLVVSAAILAKLVAVASHAMQYALLASAPYSMEAAQANDLRQRVVALLSVLAVLAALVGFLVWLFQAKKRTIALGMEGGEYSPGLTVGGFFIPFVNLYLPFAAVRELWQASRAPRDWRTQPSSALVGWWWAVWVANSFLGLAEAMLLKGSSGLEQVKTATLWMLGSSALGVASLALTLALVLLLAERLRCGEEETAARAVSAESPPPLPVA